MFSPFHSFSDPSSRLAPRISSEVATEARARAPQNGSSPSLIETSRPFARFLSFSFLPSHTHPTHNANPLWPTAIC